MGGKPFSPLLFRTLSTRRPWPLGGGNLCLPNGGGARIRGRDGRSLRCLRSLSAFLLKVPGCPRVYPLRVLKEHSVMNKPLWFFICFVFLSFLAGSAHAASDLLKREYKGFTLWLDCEVHHGATAFYYEIGRDRGRVRQKNRAFKFDRKVNLSCQPQSWRSYRTTTVNPGDGTWERGFLVPPRHMDQHADRLKETYYLTNTLPQSTTLKKAEGAWHQTEIISECYREHTQLKIWGGVIWGRNKENDYFIATHGIETPDYWWKLIYRSDNKHYVAWIFPNNRSAKAANIDRFIVNFDALKVRVPFIPLLAILESSEAGEVFLKPSDKSWPVEKLGQELRCEGKTTSRD